MPTLPIDPQYLSPPQAARYLGLTERCLAAWRNAGTGPAFVRLGGFTGRVRYSVAEIDRFMRRRMHASTSAETANTQPAA